VTAAGADRRWWRRVRPLLRWIEHALAVVGLGMLLFSVGFDLSRVVSGSMSPTLCGDDWQSGDLVLTERVSYWFRRPRRWEVVGFRDQQGTQIMKRVVGLPGEHVQIDRTGGLWIDGKPLARPAELKPVRYFAYGNLDFSQAAPCGDGYYVLGDDSRDSDDSRFNGPVKPGQIIGRAWLILAPAEHRGMVR
jgi:signal peptidase I